ncbi:hypothetical protein [Campylobacter sp.]|uniref:hypothetical protein n=1 Tax=Campylobacter sp. TaxID=205 RepID=UPI002AA84EDB|nr:hypothetical protein [Campylobacter sp.]
MSFWLNIVLLFRQLLWLFYRRGFLKNSVCVDTPAACFKDKERVLYKKINKKAIQMLELI